MTKREKDAIRALPCGKCGGVPPFADGSRCHPHRIEPALGYVAGNVVPRCPECHALEPGQHRLARTARKAALRAQEVNPPEVWREAGRKGGLKGGRNGGRKNQARFTPAERSANARMLAQKLIAKHRAEGLSDKELARQRENARKCHERRTAAEARAFGRKGGLAAMARLSPAERSALARKGALARNAARRAKMEERPFAS